MYVNIRKKWGGKGKVDIKEQEDFKDKDLEDTFWRMNQDLNGVGSYRNLDDVYYLRKYYFYFFLCKSKKRRRRERKSRH